MASGVVLIGYDGETNKKLLLQLKNYRVALSRFNKAKRDADTKERIVDLEPPKARLDEAGRTIANEKVFGAGYEDVPVQAAIEERMSMGPVRKIAAIFSIAAAFLIALPPLIDKISLAASKLGAAGAQTGSIAKDALLFAAGTTLAAAIAAADIVISRRVASDTKNFKSVMETYGKE
ncbi:MAG: hypothetical protein WC861_00760 [Candidatus Micrarchaeia archaeon]|jgi:hypothetical protein